MQPRAKTDGLIVEELSGETLVYDSSREKAHCLNPTAALVWRSCDGKTSRGEIAARLRAELHAPADEELVSLALTRLAEAKLLVDEPAAATGSGFTRRELAGRLGLVGALALLLPVVTTINAPAAAQAGSNPPPPGGCLPQDAQCNGQTAPCCAGLFCNDFVCGPI